MMRIKIGRHSDIRMLLMTAHIALLDDTTHYLTNERVNDSATDVFCNVAGPNPRRGG